MLVPATPGSGQVQVLRSVGLLRHCSTLGRLSRDGGESHGDLWSRPWRPSVVPQVISAGSGARSHIRLDSLMTSAVSHADHQGSLVLVARDLPSLSGELRRFVRRWCAESDFSDYFSMNRRIEL